VFGGSFQLGEWRYSHAAGQRIGVIDL